MTIKAQGPEVSGAGHGQKKLIQTLSSDSRCLAESPAVGSTGSSAEEDPTSVKVKYTLQQHFKSNLALGVGVVLCTSSKPTYMTKM